MPTPTPSPMKPPATAPRILKLEGCPNCRAADRAARQIKVA